jgi:hypothetical protein
MKNEKIPLQIFENCGQETWYQFSSALTTNYSIHKYILNIDIVWISTLFY